MVNFVYNIRSFLTNQINLIYIKTKKHSKFQMHQFQIYRSKMARIVEID